MDIKTLRERQHLTQEELAEASGLSVRTIQRLEAGQKAKGHTAKALSNALGVRIEEVLSRKEDSEAIDINKAKTINLSTLLFCFFPVLNFLLPLGLTYFGKQFNRITRQLVSLQIIWALFTILVFILLGFIRLTFDLGLRVSQWTMVVLVLINLIIILANSVSLDKHKTLFFKFDFTLI